MTGNKKRTLRSTDFSSMKEQEQKRRQVFKPVLDSPFIQVSWPFIQQDDLKTILELLLSILEPLGKYHEVLKQGCFPKPEAPEILDFVTLGFNSSTSSLEKQARKNYQIFKDPIIAKSKPITENDSNIRVLFVCKSDIQPALLTSHFPILCFTASRSQDKRQCSKPVKLVQLPKGTMQKLSTATGQTNCGIISLKENTPGSSILFQLLDTSVSDIDVPWLSSDPPFYKPVVKLLNTTAPIISKNKKTKSKEK